MSFVQVEPDVWVANIIGQDGYGRSGKFVRYDALIHAMEAIYNKAIDLCADVHGPKLGCGLAGGEWKVVEKILEEELVWNGIDVIVYELDG